MDMTLRLLEKLRNGALKILGEKIATKRGLLAWLPSGKCATTGLNIKYFHNTLYTCCNSFQFILVHTFLFLPLGFMNLYSRSWWIENIVLRKYLMCLMLSQRCCQLGIRWVHWQDKYPKYWMVNCPKKFLHLTDWNYIIDTIIIHCFVLTGHQTRVAYTITIL